MQKQTDLMFYIIWLEANSCQQVSHTYSQLHYTLTWTMTQFRLLDYLAWRSGLTKAWCNTSVLACFYYFDWIYKKFSLKMGGFWVYHHFQPCCCLGGNTSQQGSFCQNLSIFILLSSSSSKPDSDENKCFLVCILRDRQVTFAIIGMQWKCNSSDTKSSYLPVQSGWVVGVVAQA